MEAKDLMIGDLVRVNRGVCINKDTIVRVYGIDATNRLVEKGLEGSATCVPVDDIDFYSGGIWVKYLSPILLTPEILEKNGFEYNDEDAEYAGCTWSDRNLMLRPEYDYRIVVTNDFDDESTNRTPFVLRYVHQLQHVYKLLGIDKEITV